ncbi:hypothetical protein E2N92_04100 [Methanofollis formosanus]|uniref:Uncharacterized protein n=1 Tax=Methanofollis formosanus TaxID=299308 RepID=A0A8G1A1E1_9EURY|nr:hypothetical protein [Methanofollis formosanus]QYZ78663.1 hypothetical protein E2N92_04100 [Methanofollis formosanus]
MNLFFRDCCTIFVVCVLLACSVGYPALYLTDEWISASQLNHLVEGKDPLFGYEPYGGGGYAQSHHDCLCYTLALPVVSLPAYYLFSLFGDDFRLVVVLLWSALLLLLLLMIEFWYPQYARWQGIPWTYAGIISWGVLFVLNMALYRPFWFVRGVHPYDLSVYPEVAAIVFTNGVAFALFGVLACLIFREVFNSDRWGLFGLVATVCCSSYLFWAGNAKDHMLVALFFATALYLFTLWISRDRPLWLFASFIAVGWTAWARPELGPALAVGFFLFALALSVRKGWRTAGTTALAVLGVPLGALPLFVNNLALCGNPLLLPWVAGYASATSSQMPEGMGSLLFNVIRQFTPSSGDLFSGLYGAFIDPVSGNSAGIFQVSSLSFFALILAITVGYALYRQGDIGIPQRDLHLLAFFALAAVLVMITYLRSVAWMPSSPGIVPDMRYLSPLYLPTLVLGLYALKYVGFGDGEIKTSLKTLFWLVLLDLPLIYVVLLVISGTWAAGEIAFLMYLTYLYLGVTVTLFCGVFLNKIPSRALAYAVPVLMIFSLAWGLVVDFRFATTCWEGYHFWIPAVQYIWYIQYWLFPF